MGVAALLGGLTVIIVVLGFITSLQNRFGRPERGRRRDPQHFKDENDDFEEENSASRHKKKHTTQHHHEKRSTRREDEASHQQARRYRGDYHRD